MLKEFQAQHGVFEELDVAAASQPASPTGGGASLFQLSPKTLLPSLKSATAAALGALPGRGKANGLSSHAIKDGAVQASAPSSSAVTPVATPRALSIKEAGTSDVLSPPRSPRFGDAPAPVVEEPQIWKEIGRCGGCRF